MIRPPLASSAGGRHDTRSEVDPLDTHVTLSGPPVGAIRISIFIAQKLNNLTKESPFCFESAGLDPKATVPIKPFCILMGKFTIVASLQ